MSVKDNGIGFEPEALRGMFEMFAQVDSAIDRAEGGLGIGLALVKGLIALHGGTVEGFSAGLGFGSEFIIHLPASAVVSASLEPAGAPPPSPAALEARHLKVLVADDNRDAADSLAMVLEMSRYQVLVAHTGEQALQIARQNAAACHDSRHRNARYHGLRCGAGNSARALGRQTSCCLRSRAGVSARTRSARARRGSTTT